MAVDLCQRAASLDHMDWAITARRAAAYITHDFDCRPTAEAACMPHHATSFSLRDPLQPTLLGVAIASAAIVVLGQRRRRCCEQQLGRLGRRHLSILSARPVIIVASSSGSCAGAADAVELCERTIQAVTAGWPARG